MLTEAIEADILKIIEETNPEAYIVKMALNRGKQTVLNIKVDTDSGISLASCTEISRAISRFLEEKDPFPFAYRLEVSSPGIGFPLEMTRQFTKNVGRYLQLQMEDGSVHKGELEAVTEETLTLGPLPKKGKGPKKKPKDVPSIEISRADIQEAKVILLF